MSEGIELSLQTGKTACLLVNKELLNNITHYVLIYKASVVLPAVFCLYVLPKRCFRIYASEKLVGRLIAFSLGYTNVDG